MSLLNREGAEESCGRNCVKGQLYTILNSEGTGTMLASSVFEDSLARRLLICIPLCWVELDLTFLCESAKSPSPVSA